ncbi:MAG: endonuclease NucS [Thermoplasmata archaeon]|nr:endonuclease NucS [Thermoplasmata archaeon]
MSAGTDYLPDPSPEEALSFIRERRPSMGSSTVQIIIGRCTVDYSGRARSFLGSGERVVMIKPDGVVLVHRVGGRDPVNWQPPGTRTEWYIEGGDLVLEASNPKQAERITVRFSDVSMILVKPLEDGGDFSLVGMEKDLVDALERNPEMIEPGLVVVRREERTRSGAIDLLCRDREGNTVVVEVKRSTAGPSAASQLMAYIEDIRSLNPDAPVRGILVAPRIQGTARTLLEMNGLESVEISPERKLLSRNQRTLDGFG